MDSTYEIACRYAEKYPQKVTAVRHNRNSGGAANNFFSMLSYADGEYLMFSDDDDVWLPDKIEKTFSAMRKLEEKSVSESPILVHTNLKVVDKDLHVISDSMFQRQGLDAGRCGLNHILSQNIVTGCTMMINRELFQTVAKAGIPENFVMHDWWFALVAAALGTIGFVNSPTILYRQHSENEIGAKNAKSFLYNLKRLFEPEKTCRSLTATYRQAEEFLKQFGPMLDAKSFTTVKDYISIPHLSKWGKIQMLNTHDFWKSGFARKLGQLLFV